MGLPPRDPRSKSKNMAMKMINRIGSKSFSKKPAEAFKYPGAMMGNPVWMQKPLTQFFFPPRVLPFYLTRTLCALYPISRSSMLPDARLMQSNLHHMSSSWKL